MTKHYNVHIYREMRLVFENIDADSAEHAAVIARDKPTDEAAEIDDCNGLDLTALVDEVGDDEYEHSVDIDFEEERLRKAARTLLSAITAILPYAENENRSLQECWKRDGDEAARKAAVVCERAIEQALSAITSAKTGGCNELDIHTILAARGQIAAIWGIEDILQIRPDLTEAQAWEVLQNADHNHDATIGISWDMLECHANLLFDYAPKTKKSGEEQP